MDLSLILAIVALILSVLGIISVRNRPGPRSPKKIREDLERSGKKDFPVHHC